VCSSDLTTVLVIGADALTRHVDFTDRATCVLFGDGAGAVVLRASHNEGVKGIVLGADGSGAELLQIPAGGSAMPATHERIDAHMHQVKMNGNEVFKFAVRTTCAIVEEVLGRANVALDEVTYVLFHQANQRICDAAAEGLGLPKERVPGNIDKYGNTSTASIPLLIDELYRAGSLEAGDIIVTVGFGAGLTWGANVVRWSKGGHG